MLKKSNMRVFEKEVIDASNCKVLGEYNVITECDDILVMQDRKTLNYGLASIDGQVVKNPDLREVISIKDGLAVVENTKGKRYSIIDTKGNIIISSDDKLKVENKFIVDTKNYFFDNSYTIYDKSGNLIMDEIHVYSDSRLVRKIEDGFDKVYYELYDLKGNKITELNNTFRISTFSKFGIIQYLNKNKTHILNDDGVLVKKFKGKNVKKISDNRYLVHNSDNNWKLLDDSNNVILKGNKPTHVDYDSKIVIVGDDYKFEGFINSDNKFIDIKFEDSTIINNDRLAIKDSNYIKLIDLNGNVLMSIDNIDSNYITYNSYFDIYEVKNNGELTIYDNKLNTIFTSEAYRMKVVTDKLFLLEETYHGDTILVNSNKKIIYSFNRTVNNTTVEIKDNLIKIYGGKTLVINIDGDIIIPATDDNIILLSNNKLIIANRLVDLNDEYIDLKKSYHVTIDIFDKKITRKFDTIKAKDLFISEASKIEEEYNQKIKVIKNDAFNSIDDVYKKVKIR